MIGKHCYHDRGLLCYRAHCTGQQVNHLTVDIPPSLLSHDKTYSYFCKHHNNHNLQQASLLHVSTDLQNIPWENHDGQGPHVKGSQLLSRDTTTCLLSRATLRRLHYTYFQFPTKGKDSVWERKLFPKRLIFLECTKWELTWCQPNESLQLRPCHLEHPQTHQARKIQVKSQTESSVLDLTCCHFIRPTQINYFSLS